MAAVMEVATRGQAEAGAEGETAERAVQPRWPRKTAAMYRRAIKCNPVITAPLIGRLPDRPTR